MIGKDDVNESDIEEMLEEYYRYILRKFSIIAKW